MKLTNCLRCGVMFSHGLGPQICPECRKADEEDFKKVKDYLYENPGAAMTQVANALDISVNKIKRYLREGRLEIVAGSTMILECEKCGSPIRTGKYCDECQKSLIKDMRQAAARTMAEDDDTGSSLNGEKMRFLNKNKK